MRLTALRPPASPASLRRRLCKGDTGRRSPKKAFGQGDKNDIFEMPGSVFRTLVVLRADKTTIAFFRKGYVCGNKLCNSDWASTLKIHPYIQIMCNIKTI